MPVLCVLCPQSLRAQSPPFPAMAEEGFGGRRIRSSHLAPMTYVSTYLPTYLTVLPVLSSHLPTYPTYLPISI